MLEIFQYDFMIRACVAGLVVGALAPAIGVFLVVKRYALLADTLAHVSLVGVAVCGALGLNPMIGALIASSIGAFGIEELRVRKQLFGESVLALVLSGSLALALVIFSASRKVSLSLVSVLFGSITTVGTSDVWIMTILGGIMFLFILLMFKKLFLVAYDEELAQASGLSTIWLNRGLVVLAALTVSLSMRMVGALLVGALMVIPVLAAMQWKLSFFRTYVFAVVCSVVSVLVGLGLSFYGGLPTGAAIVLVALACFLISLFKKPVLQ